MFVLGAAFAYYIILPMVFAFFLGFQQGPLALPDDPAAGGRGSRLAGIVFQGSVSEYLTLTTRFILAFGLSFQLPVALALLGRAGLVSSQSLANTRRYAVVIILTLAACLTPPDVGSQLVLFSVVYGLYEISIQIVRRIEVVRERDLRAQGLWSEDDE